MIGRGEFGGLELEVKQILNESLEGRMCWCGRYWTGSE